MIAATLPAAFFPIVFVLSVAVACGYVGNRTLKTYKEANASLVRSNASLLESYDKLCWEAQEQEKKVSYLLGLGNATAAQQAVTAEVTRLDADAIAREILGLDEDVPPTPDQVVAAMEDLQRLRDELA